MTDHAARLARLRAAHTEHAGTPEDAQTDGPAEPDEGTLRAWFVAGWAPDDEALARAAWADVLAGRHDDLAILEPAAVQSRAHWEAQRVDAVAVLQASPRDVVARAALGEALARLGALLADSAPLEADRERFLVPADPSLPLRTERLVLRLYRPDDAPAVLRAHGDPAVAEHLLWPPLSPGQADRMLRDRLRRSFPRATGQVLLLVVEVEGRAVGDLMLRLEGDGLTGGEIGWAMEASASGRGYATEGARALLDLAFDHYAMHRVRAELDARNERSAALCERLGMTREAHFRADYWSKGELTDTLVYAIRADEWAAP